jgi:hypothetical protein
MANISISALPGGCQYLAVTMASNTLAVSADSGQFREPKCITTTLYIYRIGRKRGFALYTAFAVVCTFTIMILDLVGYTTNNKMAKTWLVIATFGGMSGAWSSAFMFAQELYPTLLR